MTTLIAFSFLIVTINAFGECNYVTKHDVNGNLDLADTSTIVPGYCIVLDSRNIQSAKWICSDDGQFVTARTYWHSIDCDDTTCESTDDCFDIIHYHNSTTYSFQCDTTQCVSSYRKYSWKCVSGDFICEAERQSCQVESIYAYYEQYPRMTATCYLVGESWSKLSCSNNKMIKEEYTNYPCEGDKESNSFAYDASCESFGSDYYEITECSHPFGHEAESESWWERLLWWEKLLVIMVPLCGCCCCCGCGVIIWKISICCTKGSGRRDQKYSHPTFF